MWRYFKDLVIILFLGTMTISCLPPSVVDDYHKRLMIMKAWDIIIPQTCVYIAVFAVLLFIVNIIDKRKKFRNRDNPQHRTSAGTDKDLDLPSNI